MNNTIKTNDLFGLEATTTENTNNTGAAVHEDSINYKQIVEMAKKASNGKEFKKYFEEIVIENYNGDIDKDTQIFCSMLAYWFGNNEEAIDKVFRESALFTNKWNYQDYRDAMIDNAIMNPIVPCSMMYSGESKLTIEILEAWLDEQGISLRQDVISREWDVTGLPPVYENMVGKLHIIVNDAVNSFWKSNKGQVFDYLEIIARKHPFNSVCEILDNASSWDEIDRLPQLYRIMGIDKDDNFSKTLIHKWLLQALALLQNRKSNPFGADGILVLHGAQGIGKTSLAQKIAICPEFAKTNLRLTANKETIIRATSCWIGELGELEQTLSAVSSENLKSFITEPVDKFRYNYDKKDTEYPRYSSFIATCNSERFLVDQTGSRRFWTIHCPNKFDLLALDDFDMLQLWKQIEFELNQYEFSTRFDSAFQRCFRLTDMERELLEERNSAYKKKVKAQQEIEDIIEEAKQFPYKFNWEYVTPMNFQKAYDPLKSYTAEVIGKALNALNIKSTNKRLNGSSNVSKGCRYLPMPIDSVNVA